MSTVNINIGLLGHIDSGKTSLGKVEIKPGQVGLYD